MPCLCGEFAMTSFTLTTDNIRTTLEGDSALDSFCLSKWGKSLTVRKEFRNRAEVPTSDLPLIMITRPGTGRTDIIQGREWEHAVRLYCGFHQPDRTKAQDELVAFEELIEDALIADTMRGGTAIDTDPESTANDEGLYHPVYFMVMELKIIAERMY